MRKTIFHAKLYIWFRSYELRRLNQRQSTAVIPGRAKCKDRLSRSRLNQLLRIVSDVVSVLLMNLIH